MKEEVPNEQISQYSFCTADKPKPDDELVDLFLTSQHHPYAHLNPLAEDNPFNEVFDDMFGDETGDNIGDDQD